MCARHLPSYRSHFQFLKKGVTKISKFWPETNYKLKVCMTQGNNIIFRTCLQFEVDFARVPQLSLLRTVVLSQAAFHRNVPNVSQPCSCHTSKILQFRKATICDENLCKIKWNLQKNEETRVSCEWPLYYWNHLLNFPWRESWEITAFYFHEAEKSLGTKLEMPSSHHDGRGS